MSLFSSSDALEQIILYLNPTDRIKLSYCCKQLYRVCNQQRLWRDVEHDHGIYLKSPIADFAAFQSQYGSFAIAHKLVQGWRSKLGQISQLEPFISFYKSDITIQELCDYWKRYNYNIHTCSFLLLHHFINGQSSGNTGFWGGYSCYDLVANLHWTPLSSESTVFGKCEFGMDCLMLNKDGMVYHSDGINDAKGSVELGLFCDFFSRLLNDWLASKMKPRQVLNIGNGSLPLVPLYPMSGEYYFELNTIVRNVEMKVSVSTIPLFFRAMRYDYSYGVCIELLKSDSPVRLQSRCWSIRYQSGVTEIVQGDGVIGNTPIFRNAGDSYFYTSQCSERYAGKSDRPLSMKGYFIFQQKENRIQINVPEFSFPMIHFL